MARARIDALLVLSVRGRRFGQVKRLADRHRVRRLLTFVAIAIASGAPMVNVPASIGTT